MADTVDTAASSSLADKAEDPRDAASVSSEDEEDGRDAASVSSEDEEDGRDAASVSSEDEDEGREEEADEPGDAPSLMELLQQLGRELGELGVSEAQLEAARNVPEVRRAARDVVGALVVVVAALMAFALVNVAAVDGLSRVLPIWLAALVLAAVWVAVAGLLLFCFMGRARRWLLWIVLKAAPTEALEELGLERDAAGKAALNTLERLGPALAVQIAMAAVPKAGDVATGVVSGVVEGGDGALEATDEIVEVVTEEIPGGGVVNQVWSVALMPGRLGIKVATTVLRRRPRAD